MPQSYNPSDQLKMSTQNLPPHQTQIIESSNDSTNTTTRLPSIQSLTQYFPPQPVPFIPLFPPSNMTTTMPHVTNNSPIKTCNSNLIFHQVKPLSNSTSFSSNTPQLHPPPPMNISLLQQQQQTCTPIQNFKTYSFSHVGAEKFQSNNSQLVRRRNQTPLTFVNMEMTGTSASSKPFVKPQPPMIETCYSYSSNQTQPNLLFDSCSRGSSDLNPPTTFSDSRRNSFDSNSSTNKSTRRKNKKQTPTFNVIEQDGSGELRTSNRNLPKKTVQIMKN